MRHILLVFAVLVATVMIVAGKRGEISRRPPIELFPDMDRQPKLRPQDANAFFKSGQSSQFPVAGTVARGSAFEETPVNNGRIPRTTNFVELLPVPVTMTLMQRGRERFDINCSPCHGVAGDGKGITSKYGMVGAVTFHDERLVRMPDGEIFNTITYGKNNMGAYAANLVPADRWAIVAYVRALQRSRLATLDDVPSADRNDPNLKK